MWAIIKSFKISIHRTKGQLPEGGSNPDCPVSYILPSETEPGMAYETQADAILGLRPKL